MFNKGKPYVPPPTRSMGTASPHDDLHDIDDELGLETEAPEEPPVVETKPSYSHAAEARGEADPIVLGDASVQTDNAEDTVEDAVIEPEVVDETVSEAVSDEYVPQPAHGGGSGGGGWGGSGGGSGGGYGGNNNGSPPSRPTKEASSVLGNGMTFEGDISGVGQLVIEGTVKGDVRVSQVLINEKGSVEGTVHADVLEVRGSVTGAIIAKQVHLHASARVEGDITQEQLTVDRGAWFSGRSTQARRGEEESA